MWIQPYGSRLKGRPVPMESWRSSSGHIATAVGKASFVEFAHTAREEPLGNARQCAAEAATAKECKSWFHLSKPGGAAILRSMAWRVHKKARMAEEQHFIVGAVLLML